MARRARGPRAGLRARRSRRVSRGSCAGGAPPRILLRGPCGIALFDVSGPAPPHSLGLIHLPGPSALAIDVDDAIAVVAAGGDGVRGLELADSLPDSPEIDNLAIRDSFVTDVEVDRGIACIASPLLAIDLADPATHFELGGSFGPGVEIERDGGLTYVADPPCAERSTRLRAATGHRRSNGAPRGGTE